MKKNITKKAAVFLLSAMVAAQSGLSVQAAALTEGNWEQTDKGWKFLNRDRQPYTGWIRTASGWYYLSAEDGSLVTGWKNINGLDYYFTPASEGIEGQMKVGWYQSPQGEWYFFDNSTDTHEEGHAVSGWNWIDGYCYYFSKTEAGKGAKMAANTTTPDGYKVNASGQWVNEDGTAQYRQSGGYRTKAVSGSTTVTSSGSGSSSDSDSDSDKTPVTPDVTEEYQYLLMNIPYADFYSSEIKGNEEEVDTVSSATYNKPRSGNLVAGSYHTNSDGSSIDGVTFPVRIKKGTDLSAFKKVTDSDLVEITATNRGQTTTTPYAGKAALFENEDFAYYELSEIPSYYKELTITGDVLSFSEVKGTSKSVSGVSAEVSTSSNYGDYQLSMTGLPESLSSSDTTVYGVILHTKEGSDYAMRHLENIWLRTNIAWASGFTEDSHGSPLSSAHYESMMGKNITGVTYYTSEGMMEIPFAEAVYVPVKFAQEIAVAENAMASNKEAAITGLDALPTDFEPVYSVFGLENTDVAFDVKDGKLTWTGSPLPGKYTLTIQDHSGKYASVNVSFILNTETSPVKVQAKEGSNDSEYELAKVDDTITDAQVKAYAKSVTAVKIGETVYSATGRGSVQIVKEDGTIDTSVKVNGSYIFESQVPTDITIQADGYPDVKGTVTVSAHYQYVLMNIPYSDFYENELENNDSSNVDVVSSATMKKPLDKSWTAGTYHTKADGSEISGVTYPVKIDEKALADLIKADSEDALYSNADYAYCVLDKTPSYYKEVKVEDNAIVAFSKSQTTLKTLECTSDANISTTKLDGNHIMHGDYELRFTDLDEDCILRDTDTVVYGAVLHTTKDNETKDYGLRYQENIFHHKNKNFEIAWATGSGEGFLTTVKNAPLSYEAYKDIMGRSLTGLTVYTDKGTVEIKFEHNKYVPLKSAANKVSVTAPELDATETTYKVDQLLFEKYDVSVTDSDDKEVEGFNVNTENNKVTWEDTVAAGNYKLVFTDNSGKYAPVTASFTIKASSVYVMMNIPYNEFYKAELSDTENVVDAVTSATHNKAVNKTFVNGSYHTGTTAEKNVKIQGVTYPVKVDPEYLKTNNTKFKVVDSEDDLFTSDDYCYVLLKDVPTYYKTLNTADGTFGEIITSLDEETIANVEATLDTNAYHCEYELALDEEDLGETSVLLNDDTVVYGAVIHTEAGEEFALRHLENIWFNTELGWDNEADGYYAGLVGQSIDSIIYYTSEGKVTVELNSLVKVTEKTGVTVTVADANASDGEMGTAITGLSDLPNDFTKKYELEYSDGTAVTDFEVSTDETTLTWTDTLKAGTYVLTVNDADGKYAPVVSEFVLSSAAESVKITENKIVIYGSDETDITEDELAAYRNAITEVYVNDSKLWGVDGNDLIDSDGTINFTATRTVHGQTSAVFASGADGDYTLKLVASGYPDTDTANVGKSYGPDVEKEVSFKVEDYDYDAKVKVVVNSKGEVVSVTDNGTEPGDKYNTGYWNTAKNQFDVFKGKTKDTIADVDVQTGATYSLTAVKSAVAEALGATNTIALANVTEAAAPAKIEFYKNEELVKNVDVDADELEALGSLEIQDVVLDPKYEDNWNEFTVVVVDADSKELDNTAKVVDDTFTITLADGRVITISFSFETEENEEEKKTDEVVTDDTAKNTTEDTTGKTSGDASSDTTEEEKKDTDPEDADKSEKEEDKSDDSDNADNEESDKKEDESDENGGQSEETEENEDSEKQDQSEETSSDDKENAAEAPEVGETTQETEVQETDTLKDAE